MNYVRVGAFVAGIGAVGISVVAIYYAAHSIGAEAAIALGCIVLIVAGVILMERGRLGP